MSNLFENPRFHNDRGDALQHDGNEEEAAMENARLTSNEEKKSTIRNDKRSSRLKNEITIHGAADKILMANALLIDRHRFVIGRPRVRPRMPR